MGFDLNFILMAFGLNFILMGFDLNFISMAFGLNFILMGFGLNFILMGFGLNFILMGVGWNFILMGFGLSFILMGSMDPFIVHVQPGITGPRGGDGGARGASFTQLLFTEDLWKCNFYKFCKDCHARAYEMCKSVQRIMLPNVPCCCLCNIVQSEGKVQHGLVPSDTVQIIGGERRGRREGGHGEVHCMSGWSDTVYLRS